MAVKTQEERVIAEFVRMYGREPNYLELDQARGYLVKHLGPEPVTAKDFKPKKSHVWTSRDLRRGDFEA